MNIDSIVLAYFNPSSNDMFIIRKIEFSLLICFLLLTLTYIRNSTATFIIYLLPVWEYSILFNQREHHSPYVFLFHTHSLSRLFLIAPRFRTNTTIWKLECSSCQVSLHVKSVEHFCDHQSVKLLVWLHSDQFFGWEEAWVTFYFFGADLLQLGNDVIFVFIIYGVL